MDRYTSDGMTDEYEALNDPRQVMVEVLELVAALRQASTRFGDAIVAGGLSAREWRTPEADLAALSGQLPEITVDDLITRLAEFTGLGPDWLKGGVAEIAHFNDEVNILYGVLRPLRVVAQRLRMLPVNERSEWPLERALGDARVGMPLDQTINALRDLDALASYIMPLTADEWAALEKKPVANASPPLSAPQTSQIAPSLMQSPMQSPPQVPQVAQGSGALLPQPVGNGYNPDNASLAPDYPPPFTIARAASPPATTAALQSFTRLRDFLPEQKSETPPTTATQPPRLADIGSQLLLWMRAHLWLNKWIVVGIAIVTLLAGTVLLSLAIKEETSAQPPATHLIAAPTHLAFACTGKNATLSLTLQNGSTTSLDWSLKPPTGLSFSATHGTLKPGATVTIQAKVTSAKAAQGTLTFTSNAGTANIPYTVACS